jgi:hypothetical protein
VVRSIRIVGKLMLLGLLGGAFALPLAAEDVTVTVPPDDPPAQAAPQPGASPALPSFSGGAQRPVADSNDPTAHPTDDSSAAASPAAPVKHKTKQKKAAAAAPAPADSTASAAASDATAPAAAAGDAAKPAAKAKTAKAASPCLNLEESACGSNSACIWVAAGTNDAGKATKARCRSLAILKKEAAKKAKTEKTATPEVLPWAANGSGTGSTTPAAASTGTTTAAAEPAKPKKTKTASAKKVSKPKTEAAPAVAPAAASEPAPADSAPPPGGDPQSSSGAD